jgi:hypothetical protein
MALPRRKLDGADAMPAEIQAHAYMLAKAVSKKPHSGSLSTPTWSGHKIIAKKWVSPHRELKNSMRLAGADICACRKRVDHGSAAMNEREISAFIADFFSYRGFRRDNFVTRFGDRTSSLAP